MEVFILIVLACIVIVFTLLLSFSSSYKDTIYVSTKDNNKQCKIMHTCKIKKGKQELAGIVYIELGSSPLYVIEEQEFYKTFITLKEYERRQSK